jgi:hypothetical protein
MVGVAVVGVRIGEFLGDFGELFKAVGVGLT